MPPSRPEETRLAIRHVVPVVLAVLPFGIVYGTLAADAGLTLAESMGMSASIYAGASQLVALQLIGIGAPLWSILLAVFALNFRHVLYSASVGRHLGRFSPAQKAGAFFLLVDPVFGAAEARASEGRITKTYYFVYGLVLYMSWLLATFIGTLFGASLGDSHALALDFILPVYFLTLLMTFRARRQFYPVALISAASSLLVYVTMGPPWHVTIGALGGILYAALAPPPRDEAKGPAGDV